MKKQQFEAMLSAALVSGEEERFPVSPAVIAEEDRETAKVVGSLARPQGGKPIVPVDWREIPPCF